MTDQEIFNLLADCEEACFYNKNQNPETPELVEIHQKVKEAFEAFAKLTGCHFN